MSEKKYPIGGYAPGDYWHKACKTCGDEFTGDKRAWNCEPCGEKAAARMQMTLKDHDQIITNQVAGMPLEEAIFQSGYIRGYDAGYERGKREAQPCGVWVNLASNYTEDWQIMHCRFAIDKYKLDTDLFEEKDGGLVKKGGTGRVGFREVEYLVEGEAALKNMDTRFIHNINEGLEFAIIRMKALLNADDKQIAFILEKVTEALHA